MPRPHKHPSITCYRKYRCRCEGRDEKHEGHEECLAVTTTWQRENRRRRGGRAGMRAGVKVRQVSQSLGEDELMRLRRAVGLV